MNVDKWILVEGSSKDSCLCPSPFFVELYHGGVEYTNGFLDVLILITAVQKLIQAHQAITVLVHFLLVEVEEKSSLSQHKT